VTFDDQVVAESQHLVDESILLVPVRDDDGVDSLIDVLDHETKARDVLQGRTPVPA
jgi:hypothetical protein